MSNGRVPYLLGGVLVAGFAALSIMSFNSLRSDINRTSEIVLWSVIKESNDKNVISTCIGAYSNPQRSLKTGSAGQPSSGYFFAGW